MVQLKLFGVPALERDGAQLTGRAAQRHRLALLALLALAPGGRLSRDKLIAYLWPESDPERGRNLLKVATYVVRAALGESALLTTGDELRLNAEVIQADVAEFEAALERADHARAVALYTGPFLDGFFLSDAPEFEHWVDREREQITGQYRKALEALAETAEAAQDFPTAVTWWKTRAAHDLYDSRIALRLMLALEASGNRAGALQHAAIHERLLDEEFGMRSTPEIAALVERLRQEPVVLPVLVRKPEAIVQRESFEAGELNPVGSPTAPAAGVPLGQVVRYWTPYKRMLGTAALVSVFSLSAAVWAAWPRAADPDRSIVVLPFDNISGDPNNEFFSDGLTEEIITRLSAVPGLKVISRTSAMHYKGSNKPLRDIARELKVDHILEGSVRHDEGRVRITAQLIDARADGHVWADNYEHELQGSFRVQEQIAQQVAQALETKLGARTRRLLARQATRDAQAYELYQRGRFVWNLRTREGHAQAIDYFQRAIERDSGFADAYAGLADVYGTGYQLSLSSLTEAEAYDRQKWAAERALALDDESADAHVSSAVALQWQRNWPGAAREYRRAIELNPGHALAHTWYSLLLRGMGRTDDALRESRRAAELDPFGVVSNHNVGSQCYIARNYDCAIEQFGRALETAPYPNAYRGRALVYAQKGMLAEALRDVRTAYELVPYRTDLLADLAFVQARAGQKELARQSLRQAKAQPLEGFSIARAHIALGEPDSAFAWLERSTWSFPHRAARGDPALDPVRKDPRFAKLVLRIEREMGMK